MTPLRLGFVGAGTITLRLLPHFTVADTASRVVVTAICDPVIERAQAASDTFFGGRAVAHAGLTNLLADDDVDAVSIASPIGLHFEHTLAAIRAGKHVHVNKTMTVTRREADILIEEAERRNVHIVASPGEMLRPHNLETKRLIESGAIGQVAWALCGAALGNYHVSEPERQGSDPLTNVDPAWYFRVPGGGPLYDLTVYSLHGLTGVLGPAVRVTAMSGILIPERHFGGRTITAEAHDNTIILLEFASGAYAVALGTAAGNLSDDGGFDFSASYFGTEGSIRGLEYNGTPLDYPGRALAQSAPDGGRRPNFGGNEWILPHITEAHRGLEELHVFEDIMQLVDSVATGVPSTVSAEHARHVVEIIEASYDAARTGIAQTLQTSF